MDGLCDDLGDKFIAQKLSKILFLCKDTYKAADSKDTARNLQI